MGGSGLLPCTRPTDPIPSSANPCCNCNLSRRSPEPGAAMRRRDFIKVIAGSAAARPLAARAQQRAQMRRIGALIGFTETDADVQSWLATFRGRAREAGV